MHHQSCKMNAEGVLFHILPYPDITLAVLYISAMFIPSHDRLLNKNARFIIFRQFFFSDINKLFLAPSSTYVYPTFDLHEAKKQTTLRYY